MLAMHHEANPSIERSILLAAKRLEFVSEEEALAMFIDEGLAEGVALHAVKAGAILYHARVKGAQR